MDICPAPSLGPMSTMTMKNTNLLSTEALPRLLDNDLIAASARPRLLNPISEPATHPQLANPTSGPVTHPQSSSCRTRVGHGLGITGQTNIPRLQLHRRSQVQALVPRISEALPTMRPRQGRLINKSSPVSVLTPSPVSFSSVDAPQSPTTTSPTVVKSWQTGR